MRHSSDNQPTIQELMAADPIFAARVAEIQREGREQDEYDRRHSIVCRHYGLFFGIGFAMAFIPLFAMLALAGRIDFGSPSGQSVLWKVTAVSAAGILLILFCAARPGSRNWATAWGKIIFVLGAFLLIAIPTMRLFDAAMHYLLS